MEVALRYPLSLDGRGRAISTYDPIHIWVDRTRLLLSTMVGERVIDLEYGTEVATHVWDSIDSAAEAVESAVRSALSTWLPDIPFSNVTVFENDIDPTQLDVEVVITPPSGRSYPVTTTINVAQLGLSGLE